MNRPPNAQNIGDEPAEVNYKQLAKIRHLKQQSQELKKLRNSLQIINQKSKQVLQNCNQLGHVPSADFSRLNSTASSFGSLETTVANNGGGLLEDLNGAILKLQQEVMRKKELLLQKIANEDRSKKEDQLFYRKILYNYEEKIAEIKKVVLNREEYIQKIERDKREKKDVTIPRKVLLTNTQNIELFEQYAREKQRMEELAKETLRMKLDINRLIDSIRKSENIALKLKMARETKMPFYKFREIMKNGIDRMSECDKEEYGFIIKESKQHQKQVMPEVTPKEQSPEKLIPREITPENLYLILRKQEINTELISKMIQEQNKLQEMYQERNSRLKEAINLRQQREVLAAIEAKINNDSAEKWASLSESGGASWKAAHKQTQMPKLALQQQQQCTSEEYKLYCDHLNEFLKDRISHITNMRHHTCEKQDRRRLGASRSVKVLRNKEWSGEGGVKKQNAIKESFYEKCNNFITERFYEDELEYEIN